MQYCVTAASKKRKYKSHLKPVILGVLFFFIIFLIFTILVVSKRENVCFYEKTYYFVYADKSRDASLLLDEQDKIKKLGGAGVFVEKNNQQHLVVSVYLNKEDAKEIEKGLGDNFQGSGVVEISKKEVSKKYINFLKQYENYFTLFKFLSEFDKNLQSLIFGYSKGEISDGKLMSGLVGYKLDLQNLLKIVSSQNIEDLASLKSTSESLIESIDYVFDKFFSTSSKESLCHELLAGFVVLYIDLCNNLQ